MCKVAPLDGSRCRSFHRGGIVNKIDRGSRQHWFLDVFYKQIVYEKMEEKILIFNARDKADIISTGYKAAISNNAINY